MKQLILFLILAIFTESALAQIETDTLSSYPMGGGFQQLILIHNGDTTINYLYKNGQLESTRPINNGISKRFDQKGNLMWEQEIVNGKGNGEMKLYAPSGIHLGTFQLKNDSIVDTLFIHEAQIFVFGRMTYSSVMHGGMRRPDGSSNISRSEGGQRFASMYVVKHNKTQAPSKYVEFNTDVNGFFLFLAEKGSFGIFPDYFNINEVKSDMGTPNTNTATAVIKNWNIKEPIQIEDPFCYLLLHMHSIGYAP